MNLDRTSAFVTGAGSGIGRACAAALASAGARVAVADIDTNTAAETAELIRQTGGIAEPITCDVTEEASLRAAAARTVELFGKVDLLHNHAGIAVGGSIADIPDSEWLRIYEFNVLSQVRGVRVFLPHLLECRGHVVNTTSSLALLNGHPMSPLVAPYIASKHAIIGWSASLAETLRPHGVGVSLLAPDYTNTNSSEIL